MKNSAQKQGRLADEKEGPEGPLVINIISGSRSPTKRDLARLNLAQNGLTKQAPLRYRVQRHGKVYEVAPVYSVTSSAPSGDSQEPRGKISGLSSASWGRMVCKLSRVRAGGFMTLTYPGDWRAHAKSPKESKQALRNFRKKLVSTYPDVLGGVWILEFQERGAPHYHLWTVHDRRILQGEWESRSKWVSVNWQRFGGGKISNWEPTRFPDAAARYAAKEGSKRFQKDPPEGWPPGRFWGEFGEAHLEEVEDLGEMDLSDLPPEIQFREDGTPYRTNWKKDDANTT